MVFIVLPNFERFFGLMAWNHNYTLLSHHSVKVNYNAMELQFRFLASIDHFRHDGDEEEKNSMK